MNNAILLIIYYFFNPLIYILAQIKAIVAPMTLPTTSPHQAPLSPIFIGIANKYENGTVNIIVLKRVIISELIPFPVP